MPDMRGKEGRFQGILECVGADGYESRPPHNCFLLNMTTANTNRKMVMLPAISIATYTGELMRNIGSTTKAAS